MKNNWDNKKIIEEIKENGFYIFEDYFEKNDLNKIKKTLLDTLNYIQPSDETDLQKKYYQIKKYNLKLKSHWYDLAPHDINLLQLLHNPDVIKLIKEFYNTDVVFSGRPCIHVHDDENIHLLDPHQETAQFARDTMVFWSPLYDTNQNNGGLVVYKDSHKHGYFKHILNNPHAGKKSWTKDYTHIDPAVADKFERLELEVKAGSAVFMQSSMVHCGYPNKTKGHVRITVTERYNPLQKIPFLRNADAPKKMPYMGLDYNKIND
tara:strand:- start:466 stop:1254 length:789 start_codon:yes stop_codon:yes gene_type:complete